MIGEGLFLKRVLNALDEMESAAIEALVSARDRDDEMRGRIITIRELRNGVIPEIISTLTKD